MPIPLIWLGLGVGAGVLGYRYSRPPQMRTFAPLTPAQIPDGAIVYCGVYGVFEHTGIWVDGSVVERHGSGLIKAISPQRFISERSGQTIRVACRVSDGRPLGSQDVADNAAGRLFTFDDYHLLERNCHYFVSQCLTHPHTIILFSELTKVLQAYHGCRIAWRPLELDS